MARPSSGVKNSQGPILAAIGGLPPLGSQGSAPAMVLAVDRELAEMSSAAVDSSIDRRENSAPNLVSTRGSRFLVPAHSMQSLREPQVPLGY